MGYNDWGKLLILILSSSVIAAVISAVINWNLQKNNYRNEYFKIVIEKRSAAYLQVHGLLMLFPFEYSIMDPSSTETDKVGWHSYRTIRNALRHLSYKGYWLSDEMQIEISHFYREVDSYYDDMNYSGPNEPIEKMIEKYEVLSNHQERVMRLMYRDMVNLHDVSKFLKDKSTSSLKLGPVYDDE